VFYGRVMMLLGYARIRNFFDVTLSFYYSAT
jgi:hypothetical protein